MLRSWPLFLDLVLIQSSFLFQVYDGRGTLEEGETAEARFIKIQAAYELLVDDEKRRKYDMDNRVNPMKVSYNNLYFKQNYNNLYFNHCVTS